MSLYPDSYQEMAPYTVRYGVVTSGGKYILPPKTPLYILNIVKFRDVTLYSRYLTPTVHDQSSHTFIDPGDGCCAIETIGLA